MDLRDGRYITPSTPATQVFFDTVTPTTEGVIFDPNTPAASDTLYISSTNSSTWIYQDGDYITYTAPVINNTEWYITGTTIDAGGNKTASIERTGAVVIRNTTATSDFNMYSGSKRLQFKSDLATVNQIVSYSSELQINSFSNNLVLKTNNLERLKIASTGAVTLNAAYSLPTTAPTSGQVLGYLGAGTTQWLTSGGGGIWGIANSSGVYTYYATWALAVAAATSGQCIELFADITENSVSYTLKNGVNINGNGHTISFSVVDGFVATSAPTICEINNIIVNQATASVSGLYINATGSIIGGNATFNSNNASSNGVYGRLVTRIYGFNCNGYNPIFTSNTISPNAVIDNVYVDSLGGGITTGTLSNSIIKSNTASGVPVGLCYTINNCYIYSNGGSAIGATIAIEVNNSTIISVTSRVLTGSPGIFTLNNCYIKSSAGDVGNGTFNNCVILSSINPINAYMGNGTFNNCTITTSASAVFSLLGSGSVNNCNVICNYNNAGGYGFYYSTCSVNNSIIQLASSSSTAFFSAGAVTMYLANNSIKGTTNFKNVNVTNGQTNTADAQGNVILQ